MADHPLSYWLSDANATERLWRSIVLFGANTAAYKFALAGALLEVSSKGIDSINVHELAVPFAKRVCDHLKVEDRQGTNPSNSFLKACRQFNSDEIDIDRLVSVTISQGFRYVFDAFHRVSQEEIPKPFFTVEGSSSNRKLHITDQLLKIDNLRSALLEREVEARWRLVETAWSMRVPTSLLNVGMENTSQELIVTRDFSTRKSIGNAKWAFSGYQDGKCFYCNSELDTNNKLAKQTHVDHVIPYRLQKTINSEVNVDVDLVWNLVNACSDCNLSKSDKMPNYDFVKRVYERNEYYIHSNHPLKDSIILATGKTPAERRSTVRRAFDVAGSYIRSSWRP
tara:strand:- start:295 stop:1311 length:1017 start_codon:yes stop_codon:yes gene_type:complete